MTIEQVFSPRGGRGERRWGVELLSNYSFHHLNIESPKNRPPNALSLRFYWQSKSGNKQTEDAFKNREKERLSEHMHDCFQDAKKLAEEGNRDGRRLI